MTPLAFIDLEMTGCSPPPAGTDRIVEIAIQHQDDADAPPHCWESLVNPGRGCTPAATEIHGLVSADLDAAPPIDELAEDIASRLRHRLIVGHGVECDLAFLLAELPPGSLDGTSWLDTRRMAQRSLRLRRHTLADVALAVGVTPIRQHRAGSDADTTRQVFWALLQRLGARQTQKLTHALAASSDRPQVTAALRQACEAAQPVIIQYDRGQGPVTRTVTIRRFSGVQVDAYCHLRQADRIFRLDRITSAQFPA